MNSSFGQPNPFRRAKGLLAVLLVHALMGYVLVAGTARQSLNLIKKPMEAVLIQDVIIPPPVSPAPPTLPKTVKPRQQSAPKKLAALPFVPPPEVPEAIVVPVPAIVAEVQPPHPLTHPPDPPAHQPQLAAPAAPAARPSRSGMAIACPTQVPPEMPRRALRDGTQGIVRAQALIRDGVVTEVVILSGPAVFHSAVRAAMLQYQCTHDGAEVVAVQEFNFRIQ